MAVPAAALPVLRSSPALGAPTFPRLAVLWYPNGTILDKFWPSRPWRQLHRPCGRDPRAADGLSEQAQRPQGCQRQLDRRRAGIGPPEGRRRCLDLRPRGQGQHERRQQQPVRIRGSDLGRSIHCQQMGRHDPSQDGQRRGEDGRHGKPPRHLLFGARPAGLPDRRSSQAVPPCVRQLRQAHR